MTTDATEKAFNGRILNVHLGSKRIEPEAVPERMYRDYLGGYGIGARLLFDRIPVGADPLGPDNVLGFFPGLLTGTPLFGIRFQVVAKSPKNNGWGDANCGGDFGPYLKHAGWDGLLLYDESPTPVSPPAPASAPSWDPSASKRSSSPPRARSWPAGPRPTKPSRTPWASSVSASPPSSAPTAPPASPTRRPCPATRPCATGAASAPSTSRTARTSLATPSTPA